jgi:Predicted 3'-5' exonuclease related to the exonuclease domain of PolB
MDLRGTNIMVVDLETERSAEDCRHCGHPEAWHHTMDQPSCGAFAAIGWERKVELGLSIGCFFDYRDMQCHWFDRQTLAGLMLAWVVRQPLLVSFNGIAFDFSLMRGLLRREAETAEDTVSATHLVGYCDRFKTLCATSYDILDAIWQVDPARKFERGLNSLDAISKANGLGAKALDGATAPRLWAQKRYADVLNYCAADVDKTRRLFEHIVETGTILRGDGTPIHLPRPVLPSPEDGEEPRV